MYLTIRNAVNVQAKALIQLLLIDGPRQKWSPMVFIEGLQVEDRWARDQSLHLDLSTSCGLRRTGSAGLEPATRCRSKHQVPRSPTGHAPIDQGQGEDQRGRWSSSVGLEPATRWWWPPRRLRPLRRPPPLRPFSFPPSLVFLFISFSSGVSKSPSEALSTLIGRGVVERSLSVAISTLIGRCVVGKPPSVAISTLIGRRVVGKSLSVAWLDKGHAPAFLGGVPVWGDGNLRPRTWPNARGQWRRCAKWSEGGLLEKKLRSAHM